MVRMWGIDERFMCRQQLLGEHVEMHMIAGSIKRGKSIEGYTLNGLIETSRIQKFSEEGVFIIISVGAPRLGSGVL